MKKVVICFAVLASVALSVHADPCDPVTDLLPGEFKPYGFGFDGDELTRISDSVVVRELDVENTYALFGEYAGRSLQIPFALFADKAGDRCMLDAKNPGIPGHDRMQLYIARIGPQLILGKDGQEALAFLVRVN